MSVFIRECTVADVPELRGHCQETFDTYGDGENEEDLQAHYERKFSPAVLEAKSYIKIRNISLLIIMNLRLCEIKSR